MGETLSDWVQLVPLGVQLSLFFPTSQHGPVSSGLAPDRYKQPNSDFTSSHIMLEPSNISHILCYAYCISGTEFGTRGDSNKQNHKDEFSKFVLS